MCMGLDTFALTRVGMIGFIRPQMLLIFWHPRVNVYRIQTWSLHFVRPLKGTVFYSPKAHASRKKKQKSKGIYAWGSFFLINHHLGGGFKYFLFSLLFGEMIQFHEHIFQMGGKKPPTSHLLQPSWEIEFSSKLKLWIPSPQAPSARPTCHVPHHRSLRTSLTTSTMLGWFFSCSFSN